MYRIFILLMLLSRLNAGEPEFVEPKDDHEFRVFAETRGDQIQALFFGRQVSDDSAPYLGHFKKLSRLVLSGSEAGDVSAEYISKAKNLEELTLSAHFTDRGVAQLTGLNRLELLSVKDAKGVTDASLSSVGKLQNLERLDLTGTSVTGEQFDELSDLKRLLAVLLGRTRINKGSLSKLCTTCPRIETLVLDETDASDSWIVELGRLTNLKSLDFADTEITSKGVGSLPVSLEYLNLSGLETGDEIWHELRKLKKLHAVSLNYTKVTNIPKGLLADLPELEYVGLFETRVPIDQQKALSQALTLRRKNE